MAARAVWKGCLRLGKHRLTVGLVAAAADRTVHFRLLHVRDETPVRQRLVNARTGKELPRASLRRGLEVEPGVVVLLTEEELAQAEPDDSRDITVTRFVDPAAVDPALYERPYWLVPDRRHRADYFALAAALEREGRVGVLRWVMRDREHAGALRAEDGGLAVVTLRHPDEVIAPSHLGGGPAHAPTVKEVELAERLIASLASSFDPERYRDEHRKRILDYAAAKARGRKPRLPRPARRAAPRSLTAALEASLKGAAKEERRRA